MRKRVGSGDGLCYYNLNKERRCVHICNDMLNVSLTRIGAAL